MQKCKSDDASCYATCKNDCKDIENEKCKGYGQDIGYNATKAACDLATVSTGGTCWFGPQPAGSTQLLHKSRKLPANFGHDVQCRTQSCTLTRNIHITLISVPAFLLWLLNRPRPSARG